MSRRHEREIPKLVGADFELANFIRGVEQPGGTGAWASGILLDEIDGVAARRSIGAAGSWGGSVRGGHWAASAGGHGWSARSVDLQDRGRKFLASNGGCAYIDLDHLEMCIPEVRSAYDHASASRAMLRLARDAQARANDKLPDAQRVQVLANNSDGRSHSYGSHLNFLVSRETWSDLFERRPHFLHFLASHQLSSMIYAGQGKVGSENDRPDVAFQIAQRADYFETVSGLQTTYRRPVVNSRDESLCGYEDGLARLHVIFYDQNLCPGASVLKVGAMQIVLALLEAGVVDTSLAIEDPVAAAVTWSHDPDLRSRVRLVDGSRATALETQERILERALRHHASHGLPTVPRAGELLDLWQDTLGKLARREFDALAGRLDWVLKQQLLERALAGGGLVWGSPELLYLDQIYASLDPDEGLFWKLEDAGLIEPWVTSDEVDRMCDEPPADTRAWTRAMLLRRYGPEEIASVDWDRLTIDSASSGERLEIELCDPLAFTRDEMASLFDEATAEGRN